MKQFAFALLSLMVSTGSLFAADTKKPAVPGTDDLSRYVAAKPTPGGQTTLRDVSGRTLGTASTVGSRTTTFRDSGGRTTGSAAIQGNQTVFREASGRTVWTATTSGGKTTTYRDAAGRTQRTASQSGSSITFRNATGFAATLQPTRLGLLAVRAPSQGTRTRRTRRDARLPEALWLAPRSGSST